LLTRLGAPASTGRHLLEAIEADQVLTTGVNAGSAWVDTGNHPLSYSVHRWTITNLITWPLVGKMPEHLNEFVRRTPRRGPVPAQPLLGAEERARFLDHLHTIAERARGEDDALLRRQAVYLLGFDGGPEVVDWLRREWKRAGRRPVRHDDLTGLLEARSASVALAVAGDSTHLHDFVNRMTDDRAEVANLNYWAYWAGELNDKQVSDRFMMDADARSWTGSRLLRHLVNRLPPDSPHLPLNLCTLHSLVASRPSLLTGPPEVRISLAGALDELATTESLEKLSRDQVAGLQYAVRMAGR
jgi:hypothetical protein